MPAQSRPGSARTKRKVPGRKRSRSPASATFPFRPGGFRPPRAPGTRGAFDSCKEAHRVARERNKRLPARQPLPSRPLLPAPYLSTAGRDAKVGRSRAGWRRGGRARWMEGRRQLSANGWFGQSSSRGSRSSEVKGEGEGVGLPQSLALRDQFAKLLIQGAFAGTGRRAPGTAGTLSKQ